MKLLDKNTQANIQMHMYNRARDIDAALLNCLYDEMPTSFILDCLMFYQTKDGGFAGGLHIDNYNTNSSVYQIYEAFRLMDMVGLTSDCDHELYDKIVNKAMNILYNREVLKNNKWNPNAKTNDNFAHAKDFSYSESFPEWGYAPTAAILGYTLVLCKSTKAYYKKALKMIDIMLKDFYQMESLNKYEFISFNSFLNSLKKSGEFKNEISKVEAKLTSLALNAISLDFEDLNAIHPLDAALYLNDPKLNEMKNQELDYIIDSIEPHGLWENKRSWGYNKYAEEDSAKLKWIGAQSVNNLFVLKMHERLEK
jgi:hypothetical protein